ncbi:MAG: 4Fe-4S dicluster domain-containing protein [Deltaproteobacteria bacterium]|nr:4Fe-4S dicluster domain-containing protein [Deltaproteobacteria bacterium]
MKLVKIDKKQWANGLEDLRNSYRLFGPVKEKDYHSFKALAKDEQPDLSFSNSRLSPKTLLFPQSEAIIEFSLDENDADHHIMKSVEKDVSPQAVIGVRPCDAKSVRLVNLNFDTPEYRDPYWADVLAATTFVGLACDEPKSTCFCTSVDCGPYSEEGLDVLLVDDGDSYLAKVLTEKGRSLLDAAGWGAAEAENTDLADRKAAAEAKIASTVTTDNLKNQDLMTLHGASFWEEVAFGCLNCGTCTYTCPTCWCFDLQDEVHGKAGKRMKNWDSCMFPLFTMHTTGHNPRGTKTQRVRQRFMHKLKYFLDKYDQGIMCVGCGRCVSQCPVNIDIRKICNLMNAYQADNAACVEQE